MPIEFPNNRSTFLQKASEIFTPPFDYVPAPNLGRVGSVHSYDQYTGRKGLPALLGTPVVRQANLRKLGVNFANPAAQLTTSQVNQPPRGGSVRVMAAVNMYLNGITEDLTGAPLANCQVLIFRTGDKSFIGETVSDGSGVWSFLCLKGGPFFFVEFKAGVPPAADKAGASTNTIVPVPG